MAECPRVLSIQSHVVSGYVGNKSASFPLQVNSCRKCIIKKGKMSFIRFYTNYRLCKIFIEKISLKLLGFEVDTINSVQFSNHTGYKHIKGQVLKDQDLSELIDGLKSNKIDFYSHLLTGYVGSVSFLNQIIQVIKHLKTVNPNLIYGKCSILFLL